MEMWFDRSGSEQGVWKLFLAGRWPPRLPLPRLRSVLLHAEALGPVRPAGMWEYTGSRGPRWSQPAPAALPFPGQLLEQIHHYSGTALLSLPSAAERVTCGVGYVTPFPLPCTGDSVTELWAFRKWTAFLSGVFLIKLVEEEWFLLKRGRG